MRKSGKKRKSLKIGVDVDNVLSDTYAAYVRSFNEYFGTKIRYEEFNDYRYFSKNSGIEESKIQEFFHRVIDTDEFIEALSSYEEARPVLSQWSRNGDSIHFITARPRSCHAATKKWLKKHGFLLHGATLDTHSNAEHESDTAYKKAVTEKLSVDLMVEDSREYAEVLTVPVLLLDRPWNQGCVLPHIIRVQKWSDIDTWVEKRRKS